MAISFQNQEVNFVLKEKLKLKSWIKTIVEKEKKKLGQINFVFSSDKEVLKANIQFLSHNTFTDIITFEACEGNTISGDILISVERVKENAQKFETAFATELKRVMIHGVFHLCGYKDKSKGELNLMRKKENAALRKF